MFVATLLTTPQERTLDKALVDSLRNAWGWGEGRWLSIDESVEFSISFLPAHQWEVWADLQDDCVDLVMHGG